MSTNKPPQVLHCANGELKHNVTSYKKNTDGKYDVTFNYGKTYTYRDVKEYLYDSTVENAEIVEVINEEYRPIQKCAFIHIYRYGNRTAYLAENNDGKYRTYDSKYIDIRFDTDNPPHVYAYLKELSNIGIKNRNGDEEKEKKDMPKIRRYYDRLKHFSGGSLLSAYCHPRQLRNKSKEPDFLIFPFGCNGSQSKAVMNALSNRLSVIQGPPGTGKTQTILNIIANLLIKEKTCLVASQNNEATKNVVQKLEKYGMGFLAASLGSNKNKEAWCNGQTGSIPDHVCSWKVKNRKQEKIQKKLKKTSTNLQKYFLNQSRLAVLKAKEAEFAHQLEKKGKASTLHGKGPHLPVSVSGLNRILFRHDSEMERKGRISPLTRVLATVSGLNVSEPDTMAAYIQQKEYETTVKEIHSIERWLSGYDRMYKEYQDLSMKYFKAILADRFGNKTGRRIWTYEKTKINENTNKYHFTFNTGRHDSLEFLKDYPVVTSSAFSASNNMHRDIRFDYLIMDEASQVSLTEGALALNVAANAVIVGDEKQLPNVIKEEDKKEATRIYLAHRMPSAYDYVKKSFLTSLTSLFPEDIVPCTMLKEHYRCHPKIIGFCNSRFYGGNLEIMSSHADGDSALLEVTTVEGNHATVNNTNEREAEEVIRIIKDLESDDITDIGIISPYSNQADKISKLLQNKSYPSATVHKFQGRENDVIIFSTVKNSNTPFIEDPNLLNVAVSRAKKRFVLVRTGNDIEEGNLKALSEYIAYHGTHRQGEIRSIFDILYKQYTDERKAFIQNRKLISEYVSENRMFQLLEEVTATPEGDHLQILFEYPMRELIKTLEGLSEEEKAYAQRSWTHVDFLLVNRTTRQPVLAIEVDGYGPHSQEERRLKDGWKDHILEVNGIEYIRFSTKGSEEKERVINKLLDIDSFYKEKKSSSDEA